MRRALLLAVCLPGLAIGEESDARAELVVRPNLCIVDERRPVCAARFVVTWESAETGYHCVLVDEDDRPLACWPDSRAGEVVDERELEEDIRYRLDRDGEAEPVAEASVEVLRMDSDDRRRNRRSRHVWDVL